MRRLITSVRVTEEPGHDRVTVWNRGACAGAFLVERGDGKAIARRLADGLDERKGEPIDGVYPTWEWNE